MLGAGAVGAYVGCLVQDRTPDAEVVLVGRRRFLEQASTGGVVLETVGEAHASVQIEGSELRATESVDELEGCEVVLVAVKSTATAQVAKQLAAVAERGGFPAGALVLSLQNGVSNGRVLAKELQPHGVCVLPCMVNFNVVWSSYCDGTADAVRIRRCTRPKLGLPCIRVQNLPRKSGMEEEEENRSGVTALPTDAHRATLGRAVVALRADDALTVSLTDDIRDVLYSKLLINLQSAVNALSRLPVPEMLSQRGYRMAWRGLILEALQVYKAAGIRPCAPYFAILPYLLAAPDWAYNLLAKVLFPLDAQCKSSMLQDIEAGRRTEVSVLNGEIVRLAKENDMKRRLIGGLVRQSATTSTDEEGSSSEGSCEGLEGMTPNEFGSATRVVAAVRGGWRFVLRGWSSSSGDVVRGVNCPGAPLNGAIVELIEQLEQGMTPGGRMEPDELWFTMLEMAYGDSTFGEHRPGS